MERGNRRRDFIQRLPADLGIVYKTLHCFQQLWVLDLPYLQLAVCPMTEDAIFRVQIFALRVSHVTLVEVDVTRLYSTNLVGHKFTKRDDLIDQIAGADT